MKRSRHQNQIFGIGRLGLSLERGRQSVLNEGLLRVNYDYEFREMIFCSVYLKTRAVVFCDREVYNRKREEVQRLNLSKR